MKKKASFIMRVAMMMFIMAIFISCTNNDKDMGDTSSSQGKINIGLNQELDEIKKSQDQMIEELEKLAYFLDQEKLYYKGELGLADYDSFMSQSKVDPIVIEDTFAKADQAYLESLNNISEMKEKYKESSDLLTYKTFLSQVFQDLMAYHYAMLEADYHLEVFGNAMNSLYELLLSGDMPSVEYNKSLDMILDKYSSLFEVGTEDNNLGDNYNKEEISSLVEDLSKAKNEVSNLEVLNEFDMQLNALVYQMLDSVGRAASATYEFEEGLEKIAYKTSETDMNESAATFLEETMDLNPRPLE